MKHLIWLVVSLVLFLLLASTGILLYRNKLLSVELNVLKTELTLLKDVRPQQHLSTVDASHHPDKSTRIASSITTREAPREKASEIKNRSDTWRAAKRAEEISRYLALTPLETDLLKESFIDAGLPAFQSEKAKQIVTNILGEDRSAKYYRAREDATHAAELERIESESTVLERKLALSQTQHEAVRHALTTVEKELEESRRLYRDQSEQVTALHSAGDAARDQLREGFQNLEELSAELRKVRQERLRELLRPTLSDEQFNKLLEMQANDSALNFDL